MKTKTFILSIVLVIIALFNIHSCTENKDNEISPELKAQLDKHLIEQNQVNMLIGNYSKNNYSKIGNLYQKKKDTKEVYYDLEVVEAYLKYVKAEAQKRGIEDLGIVVGFGQYPENTKDFDPRLNPNYYGQQTVYMLPVIKLPQEGKTMMKTSSVTSMQGDNLEGIKALDMGNLSPPEN